MKQPQEDDFVEVSENAPVEFSPSKRGVVVSVASCKSKITEASTGIPIGEPVIWVGIVDGQEVKPKVIPGKWLTVVDQIER